MAVHSGFKTVTSAGTPERLSATRISAIWVMLMPRQASAGLVYIGGSASTTGAAKGGVTIPAALKAGPPILLPYSGAPGFYDLSNIWIDAATTGEGVDFLYGS